MTAEPTTGFIAWLNAYGSIVAFFAQLAFWAILAVVAVWATLLYRRYVDFITGTVKAESVSASDEDVSVDEFVE